LAFYFHILTTMHCQNHIQFVARYLIQQISQSGINNFKLYSFFWVIPRRLNVMCRRFGTPCSFIGGVLMTMGQIKCSETSEHKIQTSGNHPKGRTQLSEHGQSLKSKTIICHLCFCYTFRPLQGYQGGIFKGLQVQEIISNTCVCFILHTYTVDRICCICTPLYIPP